MRLKVGEIRIWYNGMEGVADSKEGGCKEEARKLTELWERTGWKMPGNRMKKVV